MRQGNVALLASFPAEGVAAGAPCQCVLCRLPSRVASLQFVKTGSYLKSQHIFECFLTIKHLGWGGVGS